ncbi:MAG: hypothetical protein QXH91_06770 [Candidatus Bathyarchaeia archaeon]
MTEKIRKLQGIVVDITKTGEEMTDDKGNKWEKCIFTVELTNFSKRTPNEVLPESFKGKKVQLIRFCLFDWHFKIGARKTLDNDETEAVLAGKRLKSVFW